jgi:hypothetical protein
VVRRLPAGLMPFGRDTGIVVWCEWGSGLQRAQSKNNRGTAWLQATPRRPLISAYGVGVCVGG